MRTKTIAALATVVALHFLSSSVSGQVTPANEKVISDARAAYYKLARHDFNGFSAAIEPNWKVILADTATQENLKVFRSQHFSMTVDASGSVVVNREFDETPRSGSATPVKQIHENVQRLLSGFFGTWGFFVIGSPFPELHIKIEKLDKEYRLFYIVLSTEVTLKMTADFLITEGQLSDPHSRRTIKPVFEKTTEGFLLRGYHTVFEPMDHRIKTTIDATIDYNDVGGMKLPGKIRIKGMYGSEPVEAELKFTGYLLTRPKN